MNTVLVDIKESDLVSFTTIVQLRLSDIQKEGYEKLLKEHPFTLYKGRMYGNHMITMQIPLMDYILFMGHGLVK